MMFAVTVLNKKALYTKALSLLINSEPCLAQHQNVAGEFEKMRIKNFTLLRWISLGLIISAVLLSIFQLAVYSRLRSTFAEGTTIGGVDVSNLTEEEAATRITQVYSVPVEMHYGDDVIQAKPATLGFSLDLAE